MVIKNVPNFQILRGGTAPQTTDKPKEESSTPERPGVYTTSQTAKPITGGLTTKTSSPPPITSTPRSEDGSVCKSVGLNPDPSDCHKFYQCVSNADGSMTGHSFTCPPGTLFDADSGVCNWETLVNCTDSDNTPQWKLQQHSHQNWNSDLLLIRISLTHETALVRIALPFCHSAVVCILPQSMCTIGSSIDQHLKIIVQNWNVFMKMQNCFPE